MVSRAAIRATAASFWSSAGGRHFFGLPIDLERAVVRTLPLAVHRISNLSTEVVSEFLRARCEINSVATCTLIRRLVLSRD